MTPKQNDEIEKIQNQSSEVEEGVSISTFRKSNQISEIKDLGRVEFDSSSEEETGSVELFAPPTGQLISLAEGPIHKNVVVSEAPDPFLGQVVGNFKIIEVIGRGGFGKVYRAEHTLLHESFAVKLLNVGTQAEQEFIQRFQREARVLAQLKHENVVHLADFGLLPGGGFYLIMEYLEGMSLQQCLKARQPFPIPRMRSLVSQVCKVLGYIHEKGVIHRDIKPGNLFLSPLEKGPEKVKLIDFGIAALDDEDVEPLTQAEAFLGTAKYASPEQISGDSQLDHRSDLYSFAIILYLLVAGRLPFRAKGVMNIIHLQLNAPPPQLSQLYPSRAWSTQLETFFQSALAKQPCQRPPHADAFWKMCDAALLDQLELDARTNQSETGVFKKKKIEVSSLSTGAYVADMSFSRSAFSMEQDRKAVQSDLHEHVSSSRSHSFSHSHSGASDSNISDFSNQTAEPLEEKNRAFDLPLSAPIQPSESKHLGAERSKQYRRPFKSKFSFWIWVPVLLVVGVGFGFSALYLVERTMRTTRQKQHVVAQKGMKEHRSLGESKKTKKPDIPQSAMKIDTSLKKESHKRIPSIRKRTLAPLRRVIQHKKVQKRVGVQKRARRVVREQQTRPSKKRRRSTLKHRVKTHPICGVTSKNHRWVRGRLLRPKGAQPSLRYLGCSSCTWKRKKGVWCLLLPARPVKVHVVLEGYQPCLHTLPTQAKTILWSLREDDPDALSITGGQCAKWTP